MFWRAIRHPKEIAMQAFLASLLRHALTAGGGAIFMSDDDVSKAAGAASTLIGIAWSAFKYYQEHKNKSA